MEHKTDYYSTIIDKNTPKSEIERYAKKIESINAKLFAESKKAGDFGAKIIFWSEVDGILYKANKSSFMKRAALFAKKYKVYFAPAVVILHYNSGYAENKIIMFDPDGKIAFEYEKTHSWYSTHSDGTIKTVDTPYGKIGSAICFDADFPSLLRQAAKKKVDILLNPKYDTQRISPGHTYSGFMRAVEGGYSMISQVNRGISMATDYRGNIISYQDFFTTAEKIMIADVPTRRKETLYTYLGEWFVYLSIGFLLFSFLYVIRKKNPLL